MIKKGNTQNNNGSQKPVTSERKSIREDYTIKFQTPSGNPPKDPPKQPKK